MRHLIILRHEFLLTNQGKLLKNTTYLVLCLLSAYIVWSVETCWLKSNVKKGRQDGFFSLPAWLFLCSICEVDANGELVRERVLLRVWDRTCWWCIADRTSTRMGSEINSNHLKWVIILTENYWLEIIHVHWKLPNHLLMLSVT